jgi:hypothetical protein
LWLYATLAGVRSANALADLIVHHDAYFWLTGGILVNAHTLSAFRVQDSDFLERIFNHSVNRLRNLGLVDFDRVAQDGMRVRASAGAASFRRRETLEGLLQEAQAEVRRLEQASQEPPLPEQAVPSAQQQEAQRRHARERVGRIRQALARMPEMEAKKAKAAKKQAKEGGEKEAERRAARVSTTDPQATVMKMADGGYRPAYNVQFSTACQGQVIVGVEVVTEGTDQGQLPPMLDQIEDRFQQRPKESLVDGGFGNHEDITEVQNSCKVYAPVPEPKKAGVDR